MFYSLVEITEIDLFKDIFIALADNTTYSFTIWSVNIYGQRGASSPPMFYEIHECESKADEDSACNGKRYIYIEYKWRQTMLCISFWGFFHCRCFVPVKVECRLINPKLQSGIEKFSYNGQTVDFFSSEYI